MLSRASRFDLPFPDSWLGPVLSAPSPLPGTSFAMELPSILRMGSSLN